MVLVLFALPAVAVQAPERDSTIAIQSLDLKMRCLKDISQHNYLILYDSEFTDAEPGHLSKKRSRSLAHSYPICIRYVGV